MMVHPPISQLDRSSDARLARLRERLDDFAFANRKELRYQAQGAGYSFVGVNAVSMGDEDGHFQLRLPDGTEVHVYGSRSQPWHPYRITRTLVIEPEGQREPGADR